MTTNPIGLLLVCGALSLCACKSERDKPEDAVINSAVPYLSHNDLKELAGLVADGQPVAMKGIATLLQLMPQDKKWEQGVRVLVETSSAPTPKWPTNGKAL